MEITIKNLQKKIPINPIRIKKTIRKVLSGQGARKGGEITVCFVSDSKIARLNRKYLGIGGPTDVLAFDIGNRAEFCADILISTDTAVRNAKIFSKKVDEELDLYVIHGLLHLLGFSDHTPGKRKAMREKEREYGNT